MTLIKPDFSEVVEVTPGVYNIRVVNEELKKSQAGNEYIQWKLEIFGADDERLNGTKLTHRTMIGGKGAGILKQFINALTGEAPLAEFDTADLLNREASVVVVAGKDQHGQPSGWPEVKAVKALS